jgi:hypothetical protein
MNGQSTPQLRRRKPQGLVVHSDGARRFGRRERDRGMARVAALLMVLAGILGGLCWWVFREPPSAGVGDVVSTASVTEGPVRLAPEVMVPPSPPTGEPMPSLKTVEPPPPAGVEDLHLGEGIAQPEGASVAPPSPPRASVDPEPVSADDPNDFELPIRQ